MGEGDGKEDVTDEIEDEEQLLGLDGEEEMEKNQDPTKRELNEEEADTGACMRICMYVCVFVSEDLTNRA